MPLTPCRTSQSIEGMDWEPIVLGSALTLVVTLAGEFARNREARKIAKEARAHELALVRDAEERALAAEKRRTTAEHEAAQRALFRELVGMFDQATKAAIADRSEGEAEHESQVAPVMAAINLKRLEITNADLREKVGLALEAYSWAASAASGQEFGIGSPMWPASVGAEVQALLGYAIRGESIPVVGESIANGSQWSREEAEELRRRMERQKISWVAYYERKLAEVAERALKEERWLDQDSSSGDADDEEEEEDGPRSRRRAKA